MKMAQPQKSWSLGLMRCATRLRGEASAYTKFDESVDLALRLGVDPKRADQMVRGTTSLPHGTGKKVRVLVFAKGRKGTGGAAGRR